MIEADTIDDLSPHYRTDVIRALAVLYESGVILAQQRKERERIIDGDADQPIEEAAAALLDVRKRTQSLQAFQETCHSAHNKVNRDA